jgi:hypothetical protein
MVSFLLAFPRKAVRIPVLMHATCAANLLYLIIRIIFGE